MYIPQGIYGGHTLNGARGGYYLGGGDIIWCWGFCMFLFALLSVSFCVGCTGDSDSASDFELHTVDSVHSGFSDSPSGASSEEPEEPVTGDDFETGSDTDGGDVDDAGGVQETEN